jgi:heptosyltransferase II
MPAEPLRAPAQLVVRMPNWLGDAVMALPAIARIRRAFPEAKLTVAAPSSLAPIFRERTAAGADDVLSFDAGGEAAALAAGGFDAVLLLPNSIGSAWTARRAGIPARWGYAAGLRRLLLTRAVRRPRGRLHQSAYYLALVRALVDGADRAVAEAGPVEAAQPLIAPGADTTARAAALLEREGIAAGTPVVGFAPGAAYGHAKRWPPDRVAEVIRRLAGERGATSVLVGAAADRGAGREIESALPPATRVVNLIGRTDLRLLAGVLARCDAFVSNDSGAMHLAAALGVPVTAIFGPTDERVTAPLGEADVLVHQVFCRPCMLRDCPIDHRCMKGLTAAAVADVVSARLAAGPRRERA